MIKTTNTNRNNNSDSKNIDQQVGQSLDEAKECFVDDGSKDGNYGIEVIDEGSAVDAKLLKLEESSILKGIVDFLFI